MPVGLGKYPDGEPTGLVFNRIDSELVTDGIGVPSGTDVRCPEDVWRMVLVGSGTVVGKCITELTLTGDSPGMSSGKQWENKGCETPCCVVMSMCLIRASKKGSTHSQFRRELWRCVTAKVGIDIEVNFNADSTTELHAGL